jgi:hypothetical protein
VTAEKTPKFLLYTMTLVTSANTMGSDKEFILRGRSFIYIVRNEDSRIDA